MRTGKIYCAYCGEFLGEGHYDPREPESCGKKECNTAIRDIYREQEWEAREAAEMDNYERYR